MSAYDWRSNPRVGFACILLAALLTLISRVSH
jgi:hypothetical protein